MTDEQDGQKPEIKPKKFFSFDRKEMMYGLIIIFLLISVYEAGSIQQQMTIDYFRNFCPALNITAYSPLTGVTYHNATSIGMNITGIPSIS